MMQLLPILIGAKVDVNLVRGWTMVLLPSVIRCVPVREALSAITRVDAREVGGLGAAGIVEALFEEDIVIPLTRKTVVLEERLYCI
jgi:hypothetical protein